jgi:hypothetical protein
VLPGIILAGVVGGSAATAAVALVRSPSKGARASILAGPILMAWIVAEGVMAQQPQRHPDGNRGR